MHSAALGRRERVFYTGLAALFVLLTFAGFSRTYYLKTLFGSPALTVTAYIHGAVFTLWVLFFFAQVLLIAAKRVDLHRKWGQAGAGLAGAIVLLGFAMTYLSVKQGYATGRPNMDALFVHALMDLIVFAVLFSAGLYFRHRKDVHKRLMTLSMVAVLFPAMGRLPSALSYIGWLIVGFSIVGIVYDALFLRRIHFANVLGGALILVTTPLRFILAPLPEVHRLVEMLVRQ